MIRTKEFIGEVLSNKMKKTIVVLVERLVRHPAYGKVVRKHKKFKAHDEKNIAQPGDTVRIRETNPISKEKCFVLVEVVKKAQVSLVDDQPEKILEKK